VTAAAAIGLGLQCGLSVGRGEGGFPIVAGDRSGVVEVEIQHRVGDGILRRGVLAIEYGGLGLLKPFGSVPEVEEVALGSAVKADGQ